jgi:hypothetical protein
MDYSERYCAFVDILGFSELIARLTPGDGTFAQVRDLLRVVHKPPGHDLVARFQDSDFKAQSISDAVCISAASTAAGLGHLAYSVQELGLSLLAQGFLIRGAIVKGPLYHDENAVFGDALVRAYHLETEVARYPRVIVTTSVAQDAKRFAEERNYNPVLERGIDQGADGPYFLNLFLKLYIMMRASAAERSTYIDLCNLIAANLQRRFDESFDNPNHFEKLQWLANYWNSQMREFAEIHKITGPGIVV